MYMFVYIIIFVFIKWVIILIGNIYNYNMILKNYGIIFFFMKKIFLKIEYKVFEIFINELIIIFFGKCIFD